MLSIKSLEFNYQSVNHRLDSLNINLKPGEDLAVIMANHGGKSTLVNNMINNKMITYNHQILNEKDILFFPAQPSRKSQLSGLKYILKKSPQETVTKTVILEYCQLYNFDPQRLKQPLYLLSPFELSKIYLIIINIMQPSVVIMDNAFLYCKPFEKEQIMTFINNLKTKLSFNLIYLTHRLEDINHQSYIIIINQGQLISSGNYQQVIKQLPTNLALPFYANLSTYLKLYNLINDDLYSMEAIGDALWK